MADDKRFQVIVNGTRIESNRFSSKEGAQGRANELIRKHKGQFWIQIEDTLRNKIIAESKSNKLIKFRKN